MDKYIERDTISLINENLEIFEELKNKTVFITGATGLIGSHLVFSLLKANEIYKLNIKILALVRKLNKAKNLYSGYVSSNTHLEFIVGDILNIPHVEDKVDFIIHGASVTSSTTFIEKPVDTIKVALSGTSNILDLAVQKKVQSVVYLSSLEVYGVSENIDVTEDKIGYIDFLNPRSSYSEGKRMCENLCIAYSKQFNLPIKIARLAQTFGPGVDWNDNRVFAQFARSVINKQDIILHTEGKTARNYCYTKDAITAILYILLKGKSSEAYNVANEGTYVSILDMAKLVANIEHSTPIKVILDIKDSQALGYNPTVKIKLKTTKLEMLGWKATVDLANMYLNLISSLRNQAM